MSEPEFQIPGERLPDGFARGLDQPPDPPATPRPAATIVLLRPGPDGPEVLLLKRNRSVGFVPGAYVFPGGRVDPEDGAPDVAERLHGVDQELAAARLSLEPGDSMALAYYVSALREAFEETGILVGRGRSGERFSGPDAPDTVGRARGQLLEGRPFGHLLADLGATLDGTAMEYIAHWITPVAEPRRYDTRFFAAAVPAHTPAHPDGGEITEAVWLSPSLALARNLEGHLPMVFPTVHTLRSFLEFDTVDALMASFGSQPVPAILPRLVRTPTGVGIEVPDPDPDP